ncbi:hypothetical protein BS78_10G002800 [Paspalum vaginatum]|nr:hypothetical protein BS78_10G002800 [Paspalum vaginatum]
MGCGDGGKVLRHIRGYYREALEQLPAEEFPSLLIAGACFGLLDPVSNIIVNTAATDTARSSSRKRKRRWRQQTTEEKTVSKDEVLALVDRRVAKRSLYGLITFLVSYLRYLHAREALRYLRLAKADLAVAVRLIDLDRLVTPSSSSTTDPSSTSFKVALKCAAVSGKHPCRDAFAAIWLNLSSHPRIQELLLALPLTAGRLRSLCKKQRIGIGTRPPPTSELAQSRVFLLLDTIHRAYVKAIARFPRDALRVTHHRGLLKAGHCFGPMPDPVSNIVLNTIWYDTAFPPGEEFLADMLLTGSLARMQARSAIGLIRVMCARFPGLPPHDVIAFLLQAGANLHEAVSRARREAGHHYEAEASADGELEAIYTRAARAAWHPEPEAFAKFTLSPLPTVALSNLTSVSDDCSLTAEQVEAISASLLDDAAASTRPSSHHVPKLKPWVAGLVARDCRRFQDDQFFFRGIVEAALLKSKVPGYQLHVICGVNDKVAEDGKNSYYDIKHGHPYCHINFLARPRGSPTAAPTLFFAECTNDDNSTEVFSCCAVDPSRDDGRCIQCEKQGWAKIVHPSFGRYRGCDTDLVGMAGEGTSMTNNGLFSRGMRRTMESWLSEEDAAYFDSRWDTKLAEYINKSEEMKDDPKFQRAFI